MVRSIQPLWSRWLHGCIVLPCALRRIDPVYNILIGSTFLWHWQVETFEVICVLGFRCV